MIVATALTAAATLLAGQAEQSSEAQRDLLSLLLGPAVVAALVTAALSFVINRRLERERDRRAQELEDLKHRYAGELRDKEHELEAALERHKTRLSLELSRAQEAWSARRELHEALNAAYRAVFEGGDLTARSPEQVVRLLHEADEVLMGPLRRHQPLLSRSSYDAALAVHNFLAQGRGPDGTLPSDAAVRRLARQKNDVYGMVRRAQLALLEEGELDDG